MTLIVGLNLSDKIYLAADSRITKLDGTCEDNIVKIAPVGIKAVLDDKTSTNNLISLAVAGKIGLASFLYNKISNELKDGKLNSDIRELYLALNKEYFNNLVSEWLLQGNEYGSRCCLIFGGICPSRRKKISKDTLQKLLDDYEQIAKEQEDGKERLKELLPEDEILQLINACIQRDANKTMFDLLDEQKKPKLSTHLRSILESSTTELAEFPDSFIFCIEITVHSDGLQFSSYTAEWGQFLARGSEQITEGSLPTEIMAKFEFAPGKERNKPHLVESSILESTILDIAKKKGITTIGGSVLINILQQDKSMITGKKGQALFVGSQLLLNCNGRMTPAISFMNYMKGKDSSQAEL